MSALCRYTGKPLDECSCEHGCATNVMSAGEWVQPRKRDYRMTCCDCGLVHSLDFRIYDGKVQIRAFRVEDGVIVK